MPLWPFSAESLRSLFLDATCRLGMAALRPCLYGLRHGGASDDILTRRRSKLAVKSRGGWLTDQSLVRYSKEARAATELHKVPLAVREFGGTVGKHLEALLLHNLRFEPPTLQVLPRQS